MKFGNLFHKKKLNNDIVNTLNDKDDNAGILEVINDELSIISKDYYEASKNKDNKAVFEKRDGLVHKYQLLYYQCCKCGTCYEFHSDLAPKPYIEYNDKKYCASCWEKEKHILKKSCNDCENLITLFESELQYGKCYDCLKKDIIARREKYGYYQKIFKDLLKKQGIELNPIHTNGLNEIGRPLYPVEDKNINMIHLRDNEYALYLFDLDDGTYAFPNNGIGIRYVKAPNDTAICDWYESVGSLLAAGTSSNSIHCLTENGDLISFSKSADGIIEKSTIDTRQFFIEKGLECFTEDEIDNAVKSFCDGEIVDICEAMKIFYDTKEEKFFEMFVDGNYYHGYEVSFSSITKEKAIKSYNKFDFEIGEFIDDCKNGIVPFYLILQRLPYKEGPYSPPSDFGYGRYFV